MKKKLVTMLLASCILTSTFSLTAYADATEFETEEIVYDEDISDDDDIPVVSDYSQTHDSKEEDLQKAVADLSQFKSNLKDYKKNIKLIKTEIEKSKRDYDKLKKYYKSAEKYFKNADESLTLIKDDLYKLHLDYDLIELYLDPDMGYTRTDADLQQASLDLTEVKNYLTDTRNYLKQFKKRNKVTSERFKGDLDDAKDYVDFAIRTKDSKKIKTNKKLDYNSYAYKKYHVDYGFYSDDTISSQIKAYNKYRKSKKLPAMKNNPKLNKAAAMLALEYEVGDNFDKNRNIFYGSDTQTRPDGSRYTTAIKECGIKNFKSSSAFCISETGEIDYSDFIKDALSYDTCDKVLKGKQYTEYGIGYYSTSNGHLQVWEMILISK